MRYLLERWHILAIFVLCGFLLYQLLTATPDKCSIYPDTFGKDSMAMKYDCSEAQ